MNVITTYLMTNQNHMFLLRTDQLEDVIFDNDAAKFYGIEYTAAGSSLFERRNGEVVVWDMKMVETDLPIKNDELFYIGLL